MRSLNLSSIWDEVIIGRKIGKRKRPFLEKKPRRFLFCAFSLAMGLCTVLRTGTTAADDVVRLRGYLVLDYGEIVHHINLSRSPLNEIIHVPKQRDFAGMTIPRWINGAEFRGEKFNVVFPKGCFEEELGNAGVAYLFLEKRRGRGTDRLALKAKVVRDMAECLQAEENTDLKSVTDTDPFAGNLHNFADRKRDADLNPILRAPSVD